LARAEKVIFIFYLQGNLTMQNVEQLIEAKGYQISEFDDELLEGYQCLINANIVIPENIINPKIELGFFGVYAEFIADGSKDLEITLPYLNPGMTLMHCKLITEALNKNDDSLLKQYQKIFSDKELSKMQKLHFAELASWGEEYESFRTLPTDELKEVARQGYIKHNPAKDYQRTDSPV
jgi:hypothetical protein